MSQGSKAAWLCKHACISKLDIDPQVQARFDLHIAARFQFSPLRNLGRRSAAYKLTRCTSGPTIMLMIHKVCAGCRTGSILATQPSTLSRPSSEALLPALSAQPSRSLPHTDSMPAQISAADGPPFIGGAQQQQQQQQNPAPYHAPQQQQQGLAALQSQQQQQEQEAFAHLQSQQQQAFTHSQMIQQQAFTHSQSLPFMKHQDLALSRDAFTRPDIRPLQKTLSMDAAAERPVQGIRRSASNGAVGGWGPDPEPRSTGDLQTNESGMLGRASASSSMGSSILDQSSQWVIDYNDLVGILLQAAKQLPACMSQASALNVRKSLTYLPNNHVLAYVA